MFADRWCCGAGVYFLACCTDTEPPKEWFQRGHTSLPCLHRQSSNFHTFSVARCFKLYLFTKMRYGLHISHIGPSVRLPPLCSFYFLTFRLILPNSGASVDVPDMPLLGSAAMTRLHVALAFEFFFCLHLNCPLLLNITIFKIYSLFLFPHSRHDTCEVLVYSENTFLISRGYCFYQKIFEILLPLLAH